MAMNATVKDVMTTHVVAVTEHGRGIAGVIDGSPPVGIEQESDAADRHGLLRAIGYKL